MSEIDLLSCFVFCANDEEYCYGAKRIHCWHEFKMVIIMLVVIVMLVMVVMMIVVDDGDDDHDVVIEIMFVALMLAMTPHGMDAC